jgi:hypothetical protein
MELSGKVAAGLTLKNPNILPRQHIYALRMILTT